MKLIESFLSLTLPWRIALSTIVAFLAGPGLIGFLSEYATYWYALSERVRPPVEGIPYLSATVTITSLLIAVSVSTTFLLSRWFVGYIVGRVILALEGYAEAPLQIVSLFKHLLKPEIDYKSIEETLTKVSDAPKEFSKLTRPKALIVAFSAASIAFILGLWFSTKNDAAHSLQFAALISLYVLILFLSLWRRSFMLLISFVAALAFYFFSISLLFSNQRYSEFLKFTGFGGETTIQVMLSGNEAPVNMVLVLRSKDWLIGRHLKTQMNIEVPVQNVETITSTVSQ